MQKKTKVMQEKYVKEVNTELNQLYIKLAEMFKYLGVITDKEGKMEYEIRERIDNATKFYHSLSRVQRNLKSEEQR